MSVIFHDFSILLCFLLWMFFCGKVTVSILRVTIELHACMHAKSLQSCQILCKPMDCSPPGSSVHGILQERILKWVAIPSSRESSRFRNQTCISCDSCIASRFFTIGPPVTPWHRTIYCSFLKETSHAWSKRPVYLDKLLFCKWLVIRHCAVFVS